VQPASHAAHHRDVLPWCPIGRLQTHRQRGVSSRGRPGRRRDQPDALSRRSHSTTPVSMTLP
jgi:hypothetical protein